MTVPLPPLDPAARDAYRAAVSRQFSLMKRITKPEDLAAHAVPMPDRMGSLLPICDLLGGDAGVIHALSTWREMHQSVFPTRFIVSDERTRVWLRDMVLDVEDRIMFFVLDPNGRRIGHIGFARCLNDLGVMELSNAMRGVKDAGRGLMRMAFITIMEWARVTIGPAWFDMRVFTHNTHALTLYQSLGFRRVGEMPLRRHVGPDREDYLPRAPDDTAPPDAIHMFLTRHPADPAGRPPADYRAW